MTCLDYARALIARPSVTPDDAGCLDWISSRLGAIGFACERLDAGGVANLWARCGHAAPLLCFAGHVDVVPPGPIERWTSPPFTPTVRDGRLVGRGAADMKSSIAAMMLAGERWLARNPNHPGSLAFLLTSDEEGPAIDGTAHVVRTLAARGEHIDYCLVGEPTSETQLGDTCKIGRRGSLSARLRIQGVQGHVAYPDRIKNAVHLALPALQELVTTAWDAGDGQFPPSSLQLSHVHAGTGAGNIAPGEITIDFNVRFSPASPAQTLQSRIVALLARHGLDAHIDWSLGAQPFMTGGSALTLALSDAVHSACGITPKLSTSGGTSDGRFIIDICPQVIEFGPVNATIHQIDESIALSELTTLPDIYLGLIERLLH
jgi:succinyl-diaminopimelate desuccinylase